MTTINLNLKNCSGCNMGCAYCSLKDKKDKELHNVMDFNPDKLKEAIIKAAEAYGNTQASPLRFVLWCGEPLLYVQDLKRVIAFLKENFPAARANFSTNGILLRNDNICDWILNEPYLQGIQLSHDGVGQHIRSSFDPLLDEKCSQNIAKLLDAGKIYGIRCILNEQNYLLSKNIEFFNEWFYKYGFFEKEHLPFGVSYGYVKNQKDNKKFQFKKNLKACLEDSKAVFKEILSMNNNPQLQLKYRFHAYHISTYFLDRRLDRPAQSCDAFFTGKSEVSLNIDTSGEYIYCSLISSDNTKSMVNLKEKRPRACKNCKYLGRVFCASLCYVNSFKRNCKFAKAFNKMLDEIFGSYVCY